MSIDYETIKKDAKLILSLTSLTVLEFEKLLPFFEKALNEQTATEIENNKNRQRAHGGGRKPRLDTIELKLLFILCYVKTYPIQTVQGCLFGMSQSQVSDWIGKLSGALTIALNQMEVSPERDPENLEKRLKGSTNVSIDGTERRIQRSKNNEIQKLHYSGKKKAHTVKNNVVVDLDTRQVEYLSQTCEGKKHDKKLCDEENLTFPDEIILYLDTGFQGYDPEGVKILRPKKKPQKGELTIGEKVENSIISGVRVVVEHVISGIKRCRILKDVFRNTRDRFDDTVMEIACGLHNLRTECR